MLPEPVPGPSGAAAAANTSTTTAAAAGEREDSNELSAILGIDVNELPEGVDPSFLAALPEDMRQEVIDEQRRLQNIRQRAAAQAGPSDTSVASGVQEVSPEFLAALPPNIQVKLVT